MPDSEEINRKETSYLRKVIFGIPRLSTSLILGVESFSLFTMYFLGFGVNPILVTSGIAMGFVAIALGQFLLGWISDAKYTKLGRRKPYFIIFAPLLGISFIFLFLPGLFLADMTNEIALFLWLVLWDGLFRFSYAVTTPYQAWMAESFEVHERPEVSQVQNVFSYIGTGAMGIITFFVTTYFFDELQADPKFVSPLFALIVITIGLLTWASFYLLLFLMPKEPHYKIDTELIENLKIILKNKNFLTVVFMHGFSGVAWSIISSVMLTYTQEVLGLGTIEYVIIGGFLAIGIFIFLYIWRRRIESHGKKENLLMVFLFAMLFLPITLLGLLSNVIPGIVIGIFFIMGIGIMLGGWYLFPYIIYADLAEDDENKSGQLKAGIYTGFPFLILNIFQAGGSILLGLVLSLPSIPIGVNPFWNQFSIGLILWGPLCSLIFVVSYIYTKRYVKLDFAWEEN